MVIQLIQFSAVAQCNFVDRKCMQKIYIRCNRVVVITTIYKLCPETNTDTPARHHITPHERYHDTNDTDKKCHHYFYCHILLGLIWSLLGVSDGASMVLHLSLSAHTHTQREGILRVGWADWFLLNLIYLLCVRGSIQRERDQRRKRLSEVPLLISINPSARQEQEKINEKHIE